ncbi:GNAT family N-acetyltransferase [Bacillus toyonensis]|uniref:GNAT family N-acetyltransferase n=1 Tax=Bacillus toyonensis TaxID=155322 RepID=UPI000BF45786|nr:GNAT family N-acetyltransferase [Bacillus toyonensis]PGC85915.1 hypothetical protein COM39_23075 [Bacillus toyonensis]
MDFELTYDPQEKDLEEIKQRVIECNLKHFEIKEEKDIALFVREDEKIIAGVTGKTFGNWLEIDFLFVDESQRGNG